MTVAAVGGAGFVLPAAGAGARASADPVITVTAGSSVGIYTFASFAPANSTNNSTLGLTSVSTPESAARVNAKINDLTVQTTGAGTNWDQGLWQIAADPTTTTSRWC